MSLDQLAHWVPVGILAILGFLSRNYLKSIADGLKLLAVLHTEHEVTKQRLTRAEADIGKVVVKVEKLAALRSIHGGKA